MLSEPAFDQTILKTIDLFITSKFYDNAKNYEKVFFKQMACKNERPKKHVFCSSSELNIFSSIYVYIYKSREIHRVSKTLRLFAFSQLPFELTA